MIKLNERKKLKISENLKDLQIYNHMSFRIDYIFQPNMKKQPLKFELYKIKYFHI